MKSKIPTHEYTLERSTLDCPSDRSLYSHSLLLTGGGAPLSVWSTQRLHLSEGSQSLASIEQSSSWFSTSFWNLLHFLLPINSSATRSKPETHDVIETLIGVCYVISAAYHLPPPRFNAIRTMLLMKVWTPFKDCN